MANNFITPQEVADAAISNLYENAVMAQLVNRNYDEAFANKVGETVSVPKRTTFEAKQFDRGDGIEVQDVNEDSVDVKLDKFKDVSFAVTAEDLTLNIRDFNEQLLKPAMEAIWQQIDADLLSLLSDVSQSVESTGDGDVIIDAGEKLNTSKVPFDNRRMVAGPKETSNFLKDDAFTHADKRGDTDGLRNAEIGRKYGFDNYMDQHVSDTSARAVGFHRDAFVLATRPLAMPKGAQNAATRDYNGFGLRVVYDYDIKQKQDIVSVDTLYGVKVLDKKRAVLVTEAK